MAQLMASLGAGYRAVAGVDVLGAGRLAILIQLSSFRRSISSMMASTQKSTSNL